MKTNVFKFIFCFLSFITLFYLNMQAQKKPSLMILPSDNWCVQRYFVTNFENQGTTTRVPNYVQAFQEDLELGPVISKIGQLLTDLDYSLKDAEQEIKALNNRIAEDNVTESKSSGDIIRETPLDILKKRAKSDIVLQIGWVLNNVNTKSRSVTFTLEAFDAYTSKRIATATGTSKSSSKDIPVLLEDAVKGHIKDFDKQMVAFYKDMKTNGREVMLTIKTWENWDKDLEDEFDDEELLTIIQKWLFKNTINKSFSLQDATENMAQFEQVRIPLQDEDGFDVDTRSFTRKLQKYLLTFGIESKLMTRGLGEAILVLGEK
jgi:hypothetical protein